MFQCPGCNANVFFTPQSKSMKCPYCDTEIGVNDQVKVKYATEVKLNPAAFADIANDKWAELNEPADEEPEEAAAVQTKEESQIQNESQDEFAADTLAETQTDAMSEDAIGAQGLTSADLQETMDITVFTCTQCGGEIMAYDDTAVTFCSYCGTSTPLLSRLSAKRKPKYVIPFGITKDRAKELYAKAVKKVPFVDSQLTDNLTVEKIRGIYMPYYLYSVMGNINFEGLAERRETLGYKKVIAEYKVKSNVSVNYDQIAFDANSGFSDEMSSGIMPYISSTMHDFNINYLSGFYADTYDVNPETYDEDSKEFVVKDIDKFWGKQLFVDYTLKDKITFKDNELKVSRRDLALFPVWFLANRYGDRVSYAAVNGATGKVYVETPVSFGKYLSGSVAIAFAIFIMLSLFTMTPQIMMSICIMVAMVILFNLSDMSDRLFYHENGYMDKGMMEKMEEHKRSLAKWTIMVNRSKKAKSKKVLSVIAALAVFALPTVCGLAFAYCFVNRIESFAELVLGIMLELTPVLLYVNVAIQKKIKDISDIPTAPFKWKLKYLLKPAISILAAIVIYIINPVEDLIYYIADIAMIVILIGAIMDAIKQHNNLTTRPLPQFKKRGGDEDEHI